MDAGALNVFHDPGDQNVLSVADRVHLQLRSPDIFVHQDGMLLPDRVDVRDKSADVRIAHRDPHALAAQHIGRPHQDGIPQTCGGIGRFLRRKDGVPGGPADLLLRQDLVKTLPVLRRVHPLRRGAQDRHAHLREMLAQADGGLAAELHHCPVRPLQFDHVPDIFRGQRLKVQPVRDVKVRGHRFRIIVDDDGLISFLPESPCRVDTAEIELDPLSDADRPAAQDEDLFLFRAAVFSGVCRSVSAAVLPDELRCLVLRPVDRVEIRGLRLELRGAGVDHLEGGHDSLLLPDPAHLRFSLSREPRNHGIREFLTLCPLQKGDAQVLIPEPPLRLHQIPDLLQEPGIDHGQFMKAVDADAPPEGFCQKPDSPVIGDPEPFFQVVIVQA